MFSSHRFSLVFGKLVLGPKSLPVMAQITCCLTCELLGVFHHVVHLLHSICQSGLYLLVISWFQSSVRVREQRLQVPQFGSISSHLSQKEYV